MKFVKSVLFSYKLVIKTKVDIKQLKAIIMMKYFLTVEQLPDIMPEYMLVYGISILTHYANASINDPVKLKQIDSCLKLILKPLITSNPEFFCLEFYKNLIQHMKNHRDALKPSDLIVNHVKHLSLLFFILFFLLKLNHLEFLFFLQKMHVICDFALFIVNKHMSNCGTIGVPLNVKLPSKYYKAQPENF